MITCPNCGSVAEDDSVYCAECGFKLDSSTKASQKVSQDNQSQEKKIRFVKQKK